MAQQNDESLDLLLDVLKIDSVLGNETKVAEVLKKYFAKYGVYSQLLNFDLNRDQLIATIDSGRNGKTLALCGHMDVVRTGTDMWLYPPFAATVTDGRIYGRGTSDMKSGLVAMAIAFVRFAQRIDSFNGKLQFIATVGEESNSLGAAKLISDGSLEQIDAMIIGEPTSNQLCLSHKGALWFKVTTSGKMSHGSMPELGINAIERMLKLIPKLKNLLNEMIEYDDILGETTWSINRMEGGESTNIVPDFCYVEIDMRILPNQDIEHLRQKIKNTIEEDFAKELGFACKFDVLNEKTPLSTNKSDDFVELTSNVLTQYTGMETKPVGLSIYTDASALIKDKYRYPIIVMGPGETKLAHTTNESVLIQEFYDAIDIYSQVINRYFS